MKKIFTLFLLAFSLTSFAQMTSRLSITALLSGPVTIVIDNRSYQVPNNDRTVNFTNMQHGNHVIKIYKGSRNRRNNDPVYEDNIYIRRGEHVDIVINRFGKVFIDEQSYGNNDNQNEYQQSQAMSATSFIQFRQTLSSQSYDNTRLAIAKQTIAANKFTAQQSREIVSQFTYENNKLEIAKYLYGYTIDKNNYMVVYDAFTYSASKEELARYIQQYR